jgi:hypothetical protein
MAENPTTSQSTLPLLLPRLQLHPTTLHDSYHHRLFSTEILLLDSSIPSVNLHL